MNLIKELKKLDVGKLVENEDLSKHTTYHVGGKCMCMIYPNSKDNLIKLLDFINDNKIDFKILGKGSNIIFSSRVYDGIIIKLDELNNIIYEDTIIEVEAGVPLIKLSFDTSNQGLVGLEFLSGIPGSIGGAIYMNSGAYNSSISDFIREVTVIKDEKVITLTKDECNFSYRDSIFKETNEYIIISAKLKLKRGSKEESLALIEDRKRRRTESQPLDYPSAGSVFRNPEGDAAGRLIEECGLKGYKIGGASVSIKHANFIINDGDATGEDIKELIEYVKLKVKEKYGIELVLEQELCNF